MLILPANIYAAMNNVDHEKASVAGKGMNYLWFRIPLQIAIHCMGVCLSCFELNSYFVVSLHVIKH